MVDCLFVCDFFFGGGICLLVRLSPHMDDAPSFGFITHFFTLVPKAKNKQTNKQQQRAIEGAAKMSESFFFLRIAPMRSHSTTMHCTILVCKAAWQERFSFLHFSFFFPVPSHTSAPKFRQRPPCPAPETSRPAPPLSSRRAESPNPKKEGGGERRRVTGETTRTEATTTDIVPYLPKRKPGARQAHQAQRPLRDPPFFPSLSIIPSLFFFPLQISGST